MTAVNLFNMPRPEIGTLQKSSKGFTLVELLIVIVVVAILAAITIVAYSGVSSKARNSANIDVADAYYKALLLYKTDNSAYPTIPNYNYYCLGSNYPSYSNYGGTGGTGNCGQINQSYIGVSNAGFNTAIGKYFNNGTMPIGSTQIIPIYGDSFVGAFVGYNSSMTVGGNKTGTYTSSTPTPYYIQYALEGNGVSCGLPAMPTTSSGFPQMVNDSTQKYSWADGTNTMCVVPLPNP